MLIDLSEIFVQNFIDYKYIFVAAFENFASKKQNGNKTNSPISQNQFLVQDSCLEVFCPHNRGGGWKSKRSIRKGGSRRGGGRNPGGLNQGVVRALSLIKDSGEP